MTESPPLKRKCHLCRALKNVAFYRSVFFMACYLQTRTHKHAAAPLSHHGFLSSCLSVGFLAGSNYPPFRCSLKHTGGKEERGAGVVHPGC